MATYYLNSLADPGGDGTTPDLTGDNCAFDTIATCHAAVRGGSNTVKVYEGSGPYEQLLDNGAARTEWLIYEAESGESPVFQAHRLKPGSHLDFYIRYIGIEFTGDYYEKDAFNKTHLWLSNVGYIDVIDCTFQATGWSSGEDTIIGIDIGGGNCHDINITGTTFVKTSSGSPDINGYYYGIFVNALMTDLLIDGCEFDEMHYTAAIMGTGITFSNNVAYSWGQDGVYVRGVSDGIIIEDNVLYSGVERQGAHNDCIQIGNVVVDNVTIRRNFLYNSERQIMYLNPASGSNTYIVENNLCHSGNVGAVQNSMSISIGPNVDGIKFNNNTIAKGDDAQGNAGNVYIYTGAVITEFYNNIIEMLSNEDPVANIANEDYNIISGRSNITNIGGNSQEISTEAFEALFTDYDNNDYTLTSGSLAIDYADATYAPADDIDGVVRPQGAADDNGAYEYISITLEINVSDTITIAEIVANKILLLYKSVTDTISIVESQTVNIITFKLEGVTKDKNGDVLVNCECYLCKDNGDDTISFIAHDQSDGTGNYSFTAIVNNDASYFVIAWKDNSPHVFDITDHVLEPVVE